MLHAFILFSSIFFTLVSAWSHSGGKINLYGVEEAAEDIEVVDARGLSKESLDQTIEAAVVRAAKETSLAARTQQQLEENGSSVKVKKFLIINESNANQDYSATLMAASFVSDAYASSGVDKKKHAQWGYGIGLTTTVAFNNALKGSFQPAVANVLSRGLGFLTACLVGTGKEVLYDKGRTKNTVDKRDAYATCAGGAAITIGQVHVSF